MNPRSVFFINVQDMPKEFPPDHLLLDVREREEFIEVHAMGTENFPLSNFANGVFDLVDHLKSKSTVYVFCAIGQRALVAAEHLAPLCANTKFFVVNGGTQNWIENDRPTQKHFL